MTIDAVALLWGEHTGPRRGPKPTLTLAAVTQAGIELADAEGLAAVTMQRVAEAVGVTKMALYRYVPGKDELFALMTDTGIGEPPALTGDWRQRLEQWAREMFDRFGRHPWALETTLGARTFGPNEIAWTEVAMAALAGTGLHGGEMLDVAVTVAGHVRALVQQGASGNSEQVVQSSLVDVLRGRADRFPALAAALASAAEHGSWDQALAFGLDRILDGVELLIKTRAGA